MADNEEKIQAYAECLYKLSKQTKTWDSLTKAQRTSYVNIAKGLVDHKNEIAAELLADLAGNFGVSDKVKSIIKYVVTAILGGLAMLGFLTTSGCGHSVELAPGEAAICKDGSCLVIKDGSCLVIKDGSLSYRQAQPETHTPPVVVQDKTK